jgi:hypothetical protein
MDIEKALLLFAVVTPVIAIMTYAIYQFGYFIYHWHRVISNVTNKFAPIMGPLLLLRMSNFNATGQESLIKARYHFIRFLASILPLVIISVIGAIFKNNAN